jgi:hypothetical protein
MTRMALRLIAAIAVGFGCGCSRQVPEKRPELTGPPPSREAICHRWKLSTIGGKDPAEFGIISFELVLREDGRWENHLQKKGKYKPVIDVTVSGAWRLDGRTLHYKKVAETLEATVGVGDGTLVLDPDPVFAMPGGTVVSVYTKVAEPEPSKAAGTDSAKPPAE